MNGIETARLILRELDHDDAEAILELLNEPAFIRYIADKGVRTIEDAKNYMTNGPINSYQTNGFGLLAVIRKDTNELAGICGLIQRPEFADPDIGFALLERHWRQGYASEASRATIEHGFDVLKLNRIIALADPENMSSRRVLEKIGMRHEQDLHLENYGGYNSLYSIESQSAQWNSPCA